MEEDDSNVLILPGKKGKKRNGGDQKKGNVCLNKKQKLSKSQRRKLQKLEEEKEKELLLSKSIETLNKYQIPDYAFPLLQSSKNINRAETLLEKRKRTLHLLKEGLLLPHKDMLPMEVDDTVGIKCEEDAHSGDNINEKDDRLEIVNEREVLNAASVTFDFCPEYSSREDVSSNIFAPELSMDNKTTSPAVEARNLPCTSCASEVKKGMVQERLDESTKNNQSQTCNLQDHYKQKHSVPPIVVHVSRPTEVAEKRIDLPIVMMEQEIMEAIHDNSNVIICGETGCGKTTQVPQFLYEAGYGSRGNGARSGIVGVTQPRRVAVLATAKRVAYELGFRLGKEVGFQVRYDKKIGDDCSIKFMTDGILLREVQNDILLSRYSVLILDEAHERSLNTDILIGMLSRVIKLRQALHDKQQQMVSSGEYIASESMVFPLKLVLMSATLRVEDFTSGRLFCSPPPIIEVPTRQFPVTVHFSKRTDVVDYIGQAYKKVMAIHKRLPPGGILVFVTGQREVEYLCRKLRAASRDIVKKKSNENVNNVNDVSQTISVDGINMELIKEAYDVHENSSNDLTDRFSEFQEDMSHIEDESDVSYGSETESDLEFSDDDGTVSHLEPREEGDNVSNILSKDGSLASLKAAFEALSGKSSLSSSAENDKKALPAKIEASPEQLKHCTEKGTGGDYSSHHCALHVLPLYAMLPAACQLRVFEEVKEGERLVVVATNVAETSLTIPGIKYVVDTGREKVKNYNSSNGIETYEVQWISKASAAQRAGRAGRTGPGHCYRLYSSAVFTNMLPDFSLAEISKVPVQGVVLLLKSMHIKKVPNFPFPTPPKEAALVEAEVCLNSLEALDSEGELTPLGKVMAQYPLSPRHSRMLLTFIKIMSHMPNYHHADLVLSYAVAAAAALSLSNPFVFEHEASEDTNRNDPEPDGKSSFPVREKVMDDQEKLRRKKLKETAKAARRKFCNPTSDALTIAYALQCFERSSNPVEFCNHHALYLKTMEEMSKLRQQLLKLVFYQSHVNGIEQEYSWIGGPLQDVESAWRVSSEKYPLLLNEEQIIRKAICAGWADRVAKRIRVTSGFSEGDKKTRAVRYQACMVDENVYLHRRSSVSIAAPEFLVYNELLYSKRPYMHGVTAIEPAWLVEYARSSCNFSAPLTDPKPFYDPHTDDTKCWVLPSFGRFSWELPKHDLPVTNEDHRLQVFAYALLEGQVFPCLKSVRKYMAAPPESILKREALGQKRVGNLLIKLKLWSIYNCTTLRTVWTENPMELYSEIADWFQQGFRKYFEGLWSEMHNEVALEFQERLASGKAKGKKLKRKSKHEKY